ncbi:hypothetical protein [Escherichia coli]|uniref:hypothetical protein n=1 Tax=Escherichia coli TaxID=562 RepID=UPI0038B23EF3
MDKNILSIVYVSVLIIFGFFFIKRRYYKLDHKSLLEQPLFWVSIGVPLATCIFLGLLVWVDKWHSFSLTSLGYKRFIELSTLPLLILAAAVPLASIVNNIHRTIQTEKQITEAEKKNKTDGYYAHAKFQTDYLKSLPETELKTKIIQSNGKESEDSKTFKITYPLSLYKKLYPKCSPTSGAEYEANKHHTALILKSWMNINGILKDLNEIKNEIKYGQLDDMKILLKIWYQLEMEIIKICHYLEITYPAYQKSFLIKYENSRLTTSISSFEEMNKILKALEDISIGVVDAVNQFTMVETHVFTKTQKLFSTWGRPTELHEMSSDFSKMQVAGSDVPSLFLDGEFYVEIGDRVAAEH